MVLSLAGHISKQPYTLMMYWCEFFYFVSFCMNVFMSPICRSDRFHSMNSCFKTKTRQYARIIQTGF